MERGSCVRGFRVLRNRKTKVNRLTGRAAHSIQNHGGGRRFLLCKHYFVSSHPLRKKEKRWVPKKHFAREMPPMASQLGCHAGRGSKVDEKILPNTNQPTTCGLGGEKKKRDIIEAMATKHGSRWNSVAAWGNDAHDASWFRAGRLLILFLHFQKEIVEGDQRKLNPFISGFGWQNSLKN